MPKAIRAKIWMADLGMVAKMRPVGWALVSIRGSHEAAPEEAAYFARPGAGARPK